MRVLQIAAPARFGGLETVVRELAIGLRDRGHEILIACVLDPGTDPATHLWMEQLTLTGIQFRPIQLPRRAYRSERARLVSMIREFEPEIVHTHGYRCDVVAGSAARTLGVPRVTTVHGFTGGGWKNRTYEWLQCKSFRHAAAVVAVSGPLAKRLSADHLVASRVHLIRNAVAQRSDLTDRCTARSVLGIPPDALAVGWIGRLSAEKGPDVMVRAMTHPAAAGLNVYMVGDGPMAPALREMASSANGASIHWLGAVADAGRQLRAFDVIALSSRSEGTPMVLLEAIYAGVPVVTTRVGGVPDVVDETQAWLVEPEPAAVRAAVVAASRDHADAARRTEAASRRLADVFDADRWLQAYETLYQTVASGNADR